MLKKSFSDEITQWGEDYGGGEGEIKKNNVTHNWVFVHCLTIDIKKRFGGRQRYFIFCNVIYIFYAGH